MFRRQEVERSYGPDCPPISTLGIGRVSKHGNYMFLKRNACSPTRFKRMVKDPNSMLNYLPPNNHQDGVGKFYMVLRSQRSV